MNKHEKPNLFCTKCSKKFIRRAHHSVHEVKCNKPSESATSKCALVAEPLSDITFVATNVDIDFNKELPEDIESVNPDYELLYQQQQNANDDVLNDNGVDNIDGIDNVDNVDHYGVDKQKDNTVLVDGDNVEDNLLILEEYMKRRRLARDRQSKSRKTKLIENMLGGIEKEKKNELIRNVLSRSTAEFKDEVMFTRAESLFEAKICGGFIKYLTKLKDENKDIMFSKLVMESFSEDLDDEDFVRYLSKKLSIKPCRLLMKLMNWKEKCFVETRGRNKLDTEIQQTVYDEWLNHCIPSVDDRNNRSTVKMSTLLYKKIYGDIKHEAGVLRETKNKRGRSQIEASRLARTITVIDLKKKLEKKHDIHISPGKIWYLKPFFATNPTEKERQMCLCKKCFNLRMKFKTLMQHSRDNNGCYFDSMSEFYMCLCDCQKGEHGYWKYKCCIGECTECKTKTCPDIPNLSEKDKTTSLSV